jgi:hypothetical protein
VLIMIRSPLLYENGTRVIMMLRLEHVEVVVNIEIIQHMFVVGDLRFNR